MPRKDYSIAALHLLTGVLMGYCLFSMAKRLDDDTAYVKDVNEMWSIDLIEKFYREKCEECVAWSGVYEGTSEGCYCTTSHHRKNVKVGVHTGSCNWNQTSVGCVDIEQIPETPISKWWQGNTLFVKRLPDSSYASLAGNMGDDGACKTGFRLCEFRSMPGGGVCVPEHWISCPISAVYLDEQPPATGESGEQLNGPSLVQLHDPNLLPITDLRLAESHICRNPKKVATTEGRPSYALNRKARVNCGSDERYIELDSIGEQQLFDLHGIDYGRLPSFKTSDFFRWKRMYRRLQPVFPHCKSIFVSMKSLAMKMSIYYYSTYAFAIVWLALVLITLICRFILFDPASQGRPKVATAARIAIFLFEGTLLALCLLWFLSWSSISQLYQIEQLKCGDEGINSALAGMYERSKGDGGFYLISLALCSLVLVWDHIASALQLALNKGRFVDDQGRYMRNVELPELDAQTVLSFASIIGS